MTDDNRGSDMTGDPRSEEIEITPEMIEAGVAELFKFDPRFRSEDEAVRAIYLAMRACAQQQRADR